MAFTDNDLKKLKNIIELHHVSDEWMIKNLIARLEAAEKVCEASRIHGGPCSDPNALPNQCNLCAAYEAWRKAAGR